MIGWSPDKPPFRPLSALLGLVILSAASLHGKAVIEAFGELPSNTIDQMGDTIGGIGSGMAYDAKNDTFLCVTDRGPGDGTIPFRPRYVKLKLQQKGNKLAVEVLGSVLFKDETGREMTGLIPNNTSANTPQMIDGRICLDPEAIALASDGSLYVTDEYGPYLYQFHQNGRMIRRISLPELFSPKTQDGRLDFTSTAPLVSGRNINQGPEGMCLLPDGRHAALIFQSGLVQHGAHTSPSSLLLIMDLVTSQPKAMYSYPFTTKLPGSNEPLPIENLSLNDLCALSDTKFLVLERDSFGRNGAKDHPAARFKAVWVVDISEATNLLASGNTTDTPVSKELLFNLPALTPDPGILAAKWEGITLLTPVEGNKLTLMMSADNDFLSPVIHENSGTHPFPRAEDLVPTQFFKIRASLTRKP